ncbi:dihydrolipoamide dehydrogenase [Haloarcula vallismortis]|uniref:Dihydrolipoyl dehydrogenase n=2 Tax=Haloarcula vallismortis TaxID=28442 RepID=M0JJY0_HALVA|nr:dihydrolipoyl dehydrogenase [Haloarcula vallismortis]EMA08638.1 dihydrolipoamide dehydrogenase [Haloarcula vallismortis ATCC 29715]SDX18668.1 dihydrolipoamide dehydrogenase [Haloarcula vallismortis]
MVVGDVTTGTELLVIGGGPGGYVAAIRGAQLGLDTTLVERDAYGGTCLNHGCIPSKALISASDVAHDARQAESMGVFADPAVDMAGMTEWKDGVVTRLTRGVESLCKSAGVNLIEGTAEFVDDGTVRVAHGGEGQGSESLSFEHAVIATGSRPMAVPGFEFDGEHILSSKDALALESVPEKLLVVGAGYIGMELSTVFAKLGAEVTVVEMLDDVLPGYEDDIAAVVRDRAEELGIDFNFGEAADDWEETDEGIRVQTVNEDDAITEYNAEKCLVAVGREPVTDTLALENIDLQTDENGCLPTDDQCRTAFESVFAVGDVAGEPMLAHKAMAEGEVAAEAAAGEPAAFDHQAIPAAVFTDPEIATVGMTESEAEAAGFAPVVGQMPLRANGRALTVNEKDGFVRVVADADEEFLLGAQIVGPEASELIAELGLGIEMGARLEDIAGTIHTHPTLSEAVHEAAAAARGEAIHTQ